MLWNVSPMSEFSSVNHIGNVKDIQKYSDMSEDIPSDTSADALARISTQPEDECAKQYI